MAHGADAALDLRWGRQGGYRTRADRAEVVLAELQKARVQSIAKGEWPSWCEQEWRARATVGDPRALEVVDALEAARRA